MISFEYLPNEGGLTGLMTVTAPVTPGDLSSAAQHGRKDGNLGEQAAGGNLSSCACWFMQGGKRNVVETKGTIWLWGDLGSPKQHQDRHPHPAKLCWTGSNIPALACFWSHIAEGSKHPTHKLPPAPAFLTAQRMGRPPARREQHWQGKGRVWKVNSVLGWMVNETWSEEHTEQLKIWSGRSLSAEQSQGSSDIKPNPAQHRVLLQTTLGYRSYCNYFVFLSFLIKISS